MKNLNFKKLWFKVERIVIDTGKDDEETLRKFLGTDKKGVIDIKKYKELKEDKE